MASSQEFLQFKKLYNPRPATSWGIGRNYDAFLEFVNEEWKCVNGKSKGIYSLACDEKFGFGVFFMEGYGTKQVIIESTDDIEQQWDNGLKITSCAALDSTFYIMTEDTKEYHGKQQMWFTRSTWEETNDQIQEGYKEGKKLYFVVMTASEEG